MADRHRWVTGLQLYAYDVNDEGVEAVIEGARAASADVLLLAVSYNDPITTSETGRAPALIRNSSRARHGSEAFIEPDAALYPAGLVPPPAGDPGLNGSEAFRKLRAAAEPLGMAVVPWVLLLCQKLALQAPELAVVNAAGETVPGWLCPTRPRTASFIRAHIADIAKAFRPPAIFIDAIRFPEPRPSRIIDFCSCFCDACRTAASERGLELETVRSLLLGFVATVKRDPGGLARLAGESLATANAVLRAATAGRAVLDWFAFRHEMVERLVAQVHSDLPESTELWLDVWPPSYGWLLGQDLSRLARYGEWTRPFTYHRWGGGADIPGLIGSLSEQPTIRQSIYEAFRSFFRFPGPSAYSEFLGHGLDPAFITQETALTASLLKGRSKLAAGIQLWQLGREGVYDALKHALAAQPNGVFLHCYGWATTDELQAAGEWLRKHGLGRGGQ